MRPASDRINANFRLSEPLYKRLMSEAERDLRPMNNEAYGGFSKPLLIATTSPRKSKRARLV